MKIADYKNGDLCLGEILICTILPEELESNLEIDKILHLENLVVAELSEELRKREIAEIVFLGKPNTIFGCIEITIPIIIKISDILLLSGYLGVKGVQGVKNFIMDYPEIKAGIKEIVSDFKKVGLQIKGKEYEPEECIKELTIMEKDELDVLVEDAMNQLNNRNKKKK